MIAAAAKKVEELFDVLRIDHRNDHNTRETPMRVAKMFVEEILEGRYTAPPRITEFDNAQAYDQLIVTGELRGDALRGRSPELRPSLPGLDTAPPGGAGSQPVSGG